MFKWLIVFDKNELFKEAVTTSLIQDFEADFLWKVSLKILNSVIIPIFSPWRYKVQKDWLASRNVLLLILLSHGMLNYVSKFFYHQDINFHPWRYKVHKDWLASRNVLLILLSHGMFLSSFIIKISIFTHGGTKFTKTGSRQEMFYYY